MSGDPERRALIIGANFAGLAAAVALRRVGVEVAVFERAGVVRGIEAGVVMQITAMKALKKLGLLDDVLAIVGHPIEAIELKAPEGRVLATIPQSRLGRELGTPGYVVHRADLIGVLARQVEGAGVLRLNATCTGFEQDASGVTARFADGREERGALLIGADGIRSVVRKEVRGDGPLRYSGYTAWRAMPAFTHPSLVPGRLLQGSGRGLIFGIYPGRDRVYWFAGKKAQPGGEDAPRGRKAEVRDAFGGWFAPIEDLVEATEESAILRNDVYDRPPVGRWGMGRVTLMGDAAHPTTPTLGQGAGMAIEDAVVLAKELALARDLGDREAVEGALRAYERGRMPRTAEIVRESWQIGRNVMRTGRVECWVRDTMLRLTPKGVWRKRGEADAAYEA